MKKYKEEGFFNPKFYSKLVILPNNQHVCNTVDELLTVCISELISALEQCKSKKEIKDILIRGIDKFNKMEYDTEDKEFICCCFERIATIAGVKFGETLNKWLYGNLMGSFVNLIKNR